MKKIIFAIALMLGSISSFAQIQSASLVASGLTCSMCSKAIYKALQKLPDIQSVSVDIEQSRYDIVFRQGSKISPDDLNKAVTGAGFSIAQLKITASFGSVTVENDAHLELDGNTYHFLNVPKQQLSGAQTFTIVDKNFLPAETYKQYRKYTSKPCFESGKMEACCNGGAKAVKASRVYHVTI